MLSSLLSQILGGLSRWGSRFHSTGQDSESRLSGTDRILVQLSESRSIRPGVIPVTWDDGAKKWAECLLPELMEGKNYIDR